LHAKFLLLIGEFSWTGDLLAAPCSVFEVLRTSDAVVKTKAAGFIARMRRLEWKQIIGGGDHGALRLQVERGFDRALQMNACMNEHAIFDDCNHH
jgi:hypothetical protein